MKFKSTQVGLIPDTLSFRLTAHNPIFGTQGSRKAQDVEQLVLNPVFDFMLVEEPLEVANDEFVTGNLVLLDVLDLCYELFKLKYKPIKQE